MVFVVAPLLHKYWSASSAERVMLSLSHTSVDPEADTMGLALITTFAAVRTLSYVSSALETKKVVSRKSVGVTKLDPVKNGVPPVKSEYHLNDPAPVAVMDAVAP